MLSICTRRALIALCTLCTVSVAVLAQSAQEGQIIRIIVPFPPGGGQDAVARYFADKLSPKLGRPVVVENRAGAGGVLAASSVASSAPSSNQILMASAGPISISPNLRDNLSYVPKRDFKPVALIMDSSLTVAVSATGKYRTISDLLQDARERPGKVMYSSLGSGSNTHMLGELLAAATSVKLMHVPYKEFGQAYTDVVAGRIDVMILTEATALSLVATGKLKILGTFTAKRSVNLPDVPTLSESTGLSGLVVPSWGGMLAPTRMSSTLVDEVGAAVLAVCQEESTRAFLTKSGAIQNCAGPAEFQKLLDTDFERWHQLIKKANIKME